MKPKLKRFFIFPLIGLLFLVTACGRGTSENELKVMLGSTVVTLDTAHMQDSYSFEVVADCIDGLMQLDEKGNAIPAIAESFEVSADGKEYTFHLRDAKWSNGDPVTAHDFVFVWRRHCKIADEYSFIFDSTVACIKNAEAVIKGADPSTLGVTAKDDKTLVVSLDAPVSFFPALMSFPSFYPINEKFYNSVKEGSYGTSPDTFISNGAFTLDSYIPGTANIALKKNESYWDANRVSLNMLRYQVVSSSDNALTAFKNGTLQVVKIAGEQVEHIKSDSELSKQLSFIPEGSLYYIAFNQDPKNHHGGVLANVNMRLAITNAIDRNSLVKNYLMDGSLPTYTAVPQKFSANVKTGKFFSENQDRYKDYVSFNLEKAREHLDKAKKELNRDEFNIHLLYSNDSGDRITKIVQAVKSQLEANLPGLTVTLQPVPKAEYLRNFSTDNFDIAVANWSPDYDDPMTFLNLWTTSNAKSTEYWSSAEYDKIISDCSTDNLAINYDARWDAMYKAEKILFEQAVIAPLFTNTNVILTSPKVSGIEYHTAGVDRVFKSAKVK